MSRFKRIETGIKDLVIIEPEVFGDGRGFFMETYCKRDFDEIGIDVEFVQDNHSKSKKGVLRGLHLQKEKHQGKLIRVTKGAVWDVAVDLRKKSPTFGRSFGVELSGENKKMFYIPEGFAHGFLTFEDETEFQYKCTNYYNPKDESGILWNDEILGIDWKLEKYNLSQNQVILSEKDKEQQTFAVFRESGVEMK